MFNLPGTRTRTAWGDRDGRRRDILAAALDLLERGGYQALSMRDVASGAGVTVGTLYTYFANKEALFAVLYAARLDQLDADIRPLCARADSPETLFVAIADHYLDLYRLFGRELDVWSMVAGATDPEIAAPLARSAMAVLATVQAAIDRLAAVRGAPLVDPAERHLALPLLWATLQGLCDQFTGARHRLHPYTWDELTRHAARTLVRGLAPVTGGHR